MDIQDVLQMRHQITSFKFNMIVFILPKTSASQTTLAEHLPNHSNAMLLSQLSEITR